MPVTIEGYRGDATEPFVSTDGKYLFFNNRNDPGTNTDLYFARRINDTTFAYAGALTGANSPELDAVASMDAAGHFYFVSTRSYRRTFATIYRGTFANGKVANVSIVPGVSQATPGRVNFDAAISADGNTLYFVDARFDDGNQPTAADLVIARKTATGFARVADSAANSRQREHPSTGVRRRHLERRAHPLLHARRSTARVEQPRDIRRDPRLDHERVRPAAAAHRVARLRRGTGARTRRPRDLLPRARRQPVRDLPGRQALIDFHISKA